MNVRELKTYAIDPDTVSLLYIGFNVRLVLSGRNLLSAKNKVEADLWSTVKANWSVWGPGTGSIISLTTRTKRTCPSFHP